MAICTAAQALEEARYWIGYCEKASADSAASDAKSCFTANAGSKNYTYFGHLWGLQGQAWCAMFVTTVIWRASGQDKAAAKAALHGVLPYTACNQLYDAAPAACRGKTAAHGGSWVPQAGDVVIFQQNGVRTHTGIVESATGTAITTIEGNVGDKVNRKSYALSNTYVYEFVRPAYAAGEDSTPADTVGEAVTVTVNELSAGCTGPQVKALQRMLYAYGCGTAVDGDFGTKTASAVKKLQARLGLTADGTVGKDTWTALLTKLT